MTVEEPKRQGRPTRYKSAYCQELITHMSDGGSFETFAGKLGVARSTLYDWTKKYSEFSKAKNVGLEQAYLWWEEIGKSGITGQIKSFNVTGWIFTMKNRFGWRDRLEQQVEVSEIQEVVHQVEIGLDGDISRHRLEIPKETR